jgi:hypothetical protein
MGDGHLTTQSNLIRFGFGWGMDRHQTEPKLRESASSFSDACDQRGFGGFRRVWKEREPLAKASQMGLEAALAGTTPYDFLEAPPAFPADRAALAALRQHEIVQKPCL